MRAVVVGGGVAGLVAARRLAIEGSAVVLLEASDRLGGRVAATRVGGVTVDAGAESFAVRGGAVRALIDELGLGGAVQEPSGSAWVALPDRTVPLPVGGLLGIPSSPLATDVVRVLDARGALRAYADRVRPVLKRGRYDRLGPLVRERMGARVLDRLVASVVVNVYGADPDEVPVDAIAPGLNGAITTAGSLSGAVLQLRAAAPPGAAAQGLAGGVHRLVEALEADLRGRGVEVRTGTPVLGVHPAPFGGLLTVSTAREDLQADRVVLAAEGAAALDLLSDAAPGLGRMPRPAPAVSRAVLLLVEDRRLDDAPRGTGVLRAPITTGVRASAVTHLTAKWPELGARAGRGRHLLRLSYRGGDAVPDATVVADATALLGLDGLHLAAREDVVWTDTAPALAPETIAVRRALAGAALPDGLAVAGSWVAGTGLASVVAAAERAARPGAS
ncbi:FAD-dependent oxidoreductase [Amnibacterium setariae]|uniref:FAD-dependent oxidoreductase n=2 Tax=Amnibacterium setariae TaxID=2306585 RepID=A0A3A1U897_9MICO|nr:FAD-dependent oxidoreductase [Amnibacterium setariae]